MTRLRALAVVLPVVCAAAVAAGCGETDPEPSLAMETSPALEVVATEMAFTPSEVAVPAGEVTVTLRNEGTTLHDLRVGTEPFIVEAVAKETATKTLNLAPGRYELFCSLPGHKEAGMVGTLEVR
jgi:uncharacterized cupredoxin-like copper-binding protein